MLGSCTGLISLGIKEFCSKVINKVNKVKRLLEGQI